jgi:stage II sporulation protein GA (sporulation sigma-E factor processing peptidase)
MTIYADEVFVLNALVDFCLLRSAAALTGEGASVRRLLSGAVFGGVWAAAAAIPALSFLGRLPWTLGAYLCLCLLSFGRRRYAWKRWLWFFGICCAFAGLALTAAALTRSPMVFWGGTIAYRIPGPALAGLAIALDLLCRLCLQCFARHRGRELAELTLELGGRRVSCTALLDNGNTLTDPVSCLPVVVADWRLASRLLNDPGLSRDRFEEPWVLMEDLRRAAPKLCTRLIPYRAVGVGNGLLLAIRPDGLFLDGRPAGPRLLAFSPTELSDGAPYEAVV